MEDASLTERLKKRIQLFGQFFKGFYKPVSADHQIYDDTTKFQEKKILEFQHPKEEQSDAYGIIPRLGISSSLTSRNVNEFFSMFGNTRSIFDEFEESMKIFDEFAFILQHPTLSPSLSVSGLQSEHQEEDEDEQDARYFKFFGKGGGGGMLPSSFQHEESEENQSYSKTEEYYRDLMLKAVPGEQRQGDKTHASPSSLLRILDSWLNTDKSTNSTVKLYPFPQPNSGNYFSFSSESSSFTSDGVNITISATKIRETPEGREVITYKTNENGIREEVREFIPRKDLPNTTNTPIIGGHFRPRL